MRPLFALAFVGLTLAGCVSMDASQCRDANWYEIGFRDGLFGLQRMDIAYDDQCSRQGAKADVGAYAKGWQEGLWEYDKRKIHGGVE
jgi:hypothetical protein